MLAGWQGRLIVCLLAVLCSAPAGKGIRMLEGSKGRWVGGLSTGLVQWKDRHFNGFPEVLGMSTIFYPPSSDAARPATNPPVISYSTQRMDDVVYMRRHQKQDVN